MKRPPNRFVIARILAVAVVVMAMGWGGAQWMKARERAKVVALIPVVPEASALPSALAARIDAAMAMAKQGDPAGLVELAALYAANGWDENAQRCLEGLRQLDPRDPRWAADAKPWGDEGYLWSFDAERLMNEAEAALADGNHADAQPRLERALLVDPSKGSIHWRVARAWEAMRDQVKAMEHYEQAVTLDASLADAWLRLATLQRAIGETTKAWQSLVAGVKASPDDVALLLARGNAYAEREQFEKALIDFQRVVALRPDDVVGYLMSSRVLFAMGHPQDAATTLASALEAFPDHPAILVPLALMAISAQDQAVADRWLARIDANATVSPADRAQLAAAYRQAFGQIAPNGSP